jgi:hypothetical protein
MASSGRLARVLQRWRSTSSQPYPPLMHWPSVVWSPLSAKSLPPGGLIRWFRPARISGSLAGALDFSESWETSALIASCQIVVLRASRCRRSGTYSASEITCRSDGVVPRGAAPEGASEELAVPAGFVPSRFCVFAALPTPLGSLPCYFTQQYWWDYVRGNRRYPSEHKPR